MGRRCCVAGCNSTSRLPEHIGVTYHSFPLDHNMRAIWIRNTRLSSVRQITKSVLVCSRHFRRADFQPQRRGKYLLKQKVFPTVFPWGKLDPARFEADLKRINTTARSSTKVSTTTSAAEEEDTKATVEATVAQIMAQTAELNAAAGLKSNKSDDDAPAECQDVENNATSVKFEAITSFSPGVRLEAQDFDGVWHTARVVEVDNDDREVLIKFEKVGKSKSALVGTEEWIPMNSTRLRQRISNKVIPVFVLEEKCMARWSGPRKFPGTIKKILPNDSYEVLFDDGYIKNVRAIHMTKVQSSQNESVEESATTSTEHRPSTTSGKKPVGSSNKKRAIPGSRRHWPLLDMSKLDLASLNLPEVPRDGEWTCHWVNDQPIGREGYLVVGEHRKPTVIVDDWRLPPGWVKHMYQRSNVLGKWDVILVTPSGKRFRSKSDLKTYLEDQGEVYNPDVYDFSIHRRRAKDINCYAFTPDYVPHFAHKTKAPPLSEKTTTTKETAAFLTNLSPTTTGPFLNSPLTESVPPIELLTNTVSEDKNITHVDSEVPKQLLESADASSTPTPTPTSTPTALNKDDNNALNATTSQSLNLMDEKGGGGDRQRDGAGGGDEYAYIGDLKVQIIDNLFRCPQEGCSKNFRKENHLQIHVKHYHQNLNKLLGSCPKMQELAEKRTHPGESDTVEPTPKNQIPNQQFFAKLHQQDLEQTRARSRSMGIAKHQHDTANSKSPNNIELDDSTDADGEEFQQNAANNTAVTHDRIVSLLEDDSNGKDEDDVVEIPSKRSRFTPSKRPFNSRRSNRQRTARRYITAHQTNTGALQVPSLITAEETNYEDIIDIEESGRNSSNSASPDDDGEKTLVETQDSATTPASEAECGDSDGSEGSTEDSDASEDSDDADDSEASDEEASGGSEDSEVSDVSEDSENIEGTDSASACDTSSNDSESQSTTHYIKEDGEIIKIVSMRQEEIINCLCGYGEENGLMIQCDLCLCWQHGFCNGIDKESDVPEKYVCYICRNPERGRSSLRFKHDQDWLFDGKLPTANFHIQNEAVMRRAEFLQRSHTLTGNLLELKEFMHSLRVKINIANNKCHPKLYLWANKWDDEESTTTNTDSATEAIDLDGNSSSSPSKQSETVETAPAAEPTPTIPQPEAPIDPAECQQRLLEHIKVQQQLVMERLNEIEAAVDELEREDNLPDLKDADVSVTKDVLATFVKELDIVQRIAKLNKLEGSNSS